jgi:hypothetical protein
MDNGMDTVSGGGVWVCVGGCNQAFFDCRVVIGVRVGGRVAGKGCGRGRGGL